MCLLIVLSRVRPGEPLVVAANRDERHDRAAVPMAVLSERHPRVLGGRDELAGGTWLAVNDAGVVAGLTNRPVDGGRDPARRSRGELPLLLTRHETASAAVAEIAKQVDPDAYNPCWMLAGDRTSLFALDLSGPGAVGVVELGAGVHVLENSAYGARSAKVDHVRRLLQGVEAMELDELERRLVTVLGDHEVPAEPAAGRLLHAGAPRLPSSVVRAACVHSERYGTRWSALVTVPADPDARPGFRYADGPPCTAPLSDAGPLWQGGP